MENQNKIQTLEQMDGMLFGPIPCNGAVCIPRARYDELVRAGMEREILFHAYQQMDSYDMEKVLDSIFNPKFKYNPKAAHRAGAVPEESAAGAE